MNWHLFFGAVLSLSGAAVFILAVRETVRSASTRRWPVTSGAVIESRVDEEWNDGKWHHLKIAYRYEIYGKTYVGTHIHAAPPTVWSWSWPARRTAEKYAIGSRVRVYYSPSDPSESVLERGISAARLVSLVVVMTILLGNAWNQLK
jgi:hypothetical protein